MTAELLLSEENTATPTIRSRADDAASFNLSSQCGSTCQAHLQTTCLL